MPVPGASGRAVLLLRGAWSFLRLQLPEGFILRMGAAVAAVLPEAGAPLFISAFLMISSASRQFPVMEFQSACPMVRAGKSLEPIPTQ